MKAEKEKEYNGSFEKEDKKEVLKKTRGRSIQETAKIILDFFKKPFQGKSNEELVFQEKFNAKEYIETYYPRIDDMEGSLETFKEVQAEIKGSNGIFNMKETMEKKELSPEEVENIFIFDFQRHVSKELLQAFPEDHIKTLDVGGGPTIYQHIFTAMVAGNITHSEFLEANRKEVTSWVESSGDEHNWDSYFKFIKTIIKDDPGYVEIIKNNLESENSDIKNHAIKLNSLLTEGGESGIKENLREVIGGKVTFGDVFKDDLGIGKENDNYEFVNSSTRESAIELVTSNFTIESATEDRDKWQNGMINIMNKVKAGGYLSLSAIRNSSWYKVGEEKLPATEINEDDLAKILEENGFNILEQRVLEGSNKEEDGYDGMIFIFANKTI